MPSIGIVLGAGGVVGAAYHAGVLTALAEAGFDARRADLIVGTSAGSGVGATLRAGFPPLDLAARALGHSLSEEASSVIGQATGQLNLSYERRLGMGSLRPASPGLVFRAGGRPAKALAGLLPSGTISADAIGERISQLYPTSSWPGSSLWICAVDLESGDRVVFGRDDASAPIGVAVQASSSIPGFFAPVEFEGRRLVDGGVHSPTNADLLVGEGHDLVVIISPMSSTGGVRRSIFDGGRSVHRWQLGSEVERLRRAGTKVLTFQPTAPELAAMGRNPMDPERRAPTTLAARASARSRLADPMVADRLALLRST